MAVRMLALLHSAEAPASRARLLLHAAPSHLTLEEHDWSTASFPTATSPCRSPAPPPHPPYLILQRPQLPLAPVQLCLQAIPRLLALRHLAAHALHVVVQLRALLQCTLALLQHAVHQVADHSCVRGRARQQVEGRGEAKSCMLQGDVQSVSGVGYSRQQEWRLTVTNRNAGPVQLWRAA